MTIRAKSVLTLAGFFIVSLLGIGLATNIVVLPGFATVEKANVTEDMQRVVNSLNYELVQMNAKGTDWSYWGDTYEFVQNHNQAYIDENLTSVITGQKIEFWLFYNNKRELVQETGYDLKTAEPSKIPDSLRDFLPSSALTGLTAADAAGKKAYINLPDGNMMMVAARPILNSQSESAGTLVMANFINREKIKELSDITHLNIDIMSSSSRDLPKDVKDYLATNNSDIAATPINYETIMGYARISDFAGGADMVVKISHERDIFNQGTLAIYYFFVILVTVFLAITLILVLLLNRFVINPVGRLVGQVERIGSANGPTRVVGLDRKDEVGLLTGHINSMLSNLETMHLELQQERDSVERKVVERTRDLAEVTAELEAAVRSLPFGFAVIDRDNTAVYANQILPELIGHSGDTATKRDEVWLVDAIQESFKNDIDFIKLLNDARDDNRQTEENIVLGNRDMRLFLMPIASKKKGGRTLGSVMILEDITEQKKLDRMKTELIYLASHQLRTPASAVKSNLSLLVDGYGGELTAQQIDIIGMAYKENNAELKIIHDVLDVAKLDSRETNIEPAEFNLGMLVREVVRAEKSESALRKQQVEVTVSGKISVQADRDRLRAAIDNLIINAIKYTPTAGKITVSLKENGANAEIAISDNGIGIPSDEISEMFKRFSRASNATSMSMSGAGLGLYLAKSMVEMHGGSIKVVSKLGKGSTFTIILPLKNKQ